MTRPVAALCGLAVGLAMVLVVAAGLYILALRVATESARQVVKAQDLLIQVIPIPADQTTIAKGDSHD